MDNLFLQTLHDVFDVHSSDKHQTSFLFMAENYSVAWIYHNFAYSSSDWLVSTFRIL
jgi:hypothetical protein